MLPDLNILLGLYHKIKQMSNWLKAAQGPRPVSPITKDIPCNRYWNKETVKWWLPKRGVKFLNTNRKTRYERTTGQKNQLVAVAILTGSAATVTGGVETGIVVRTGNTIATKEAYRSNKCSLNIVFIKENLMLRWGMKRKVRGINSLSLPQDCK